MTHILPKLVDVGNPCDAPQVESPPIPPILHLIWVGPREIPAYATTNIDRWRELLPATWTVRLWTNADLTEANFDAAFLARIGAATAGAQKADMMRYYILATVGGFYADTDIRPVRSLEPIRRLGHPLILCHDNDITWGYCQCAFFAAVPGHPFFQAAVDRCRTVTLGTPDIHLHTGPRLVGLVLESLSPGIGDSWALLPIRTFYVNEDSRYDALRFGTHMYAKEW